MHRLRFRRSRQIEGISVQRFHVRAGRLEALTARPNSACGGTQLPSVLVARPTLLRPRALLVPSPAALKSHVLVCKRGHRSSTTAGPAGWLLAADLVAPQAATVIAAMANVRRRTVIPASPASRPRRPGLWRRPPQSRPPIEIHEPQANLPLRTRPGRPPGEAQHSRPRPTARPSEPPTNRRVTEQSVWSRARVRALLVGSIAFLASHPIGSDPGAGCEALGDRGHRPHGPIQNVVETVQGEPVDDLLASAFSLDESAVT